MDLTLIDALLEHPWFLMHSSMGGVLHDLAFLRACVVDPPQEFVKDGRLKKLQSLLNKAGLIIKPFDLKQMDKDMAGKLRKALTGVSIPVWCWRFPSLRIYDEVFNPPQEDYPGTSGLCFIDHLVENLERLAEGKDDSIVPLKYHILRIQRDLQFTSSHLKAIAEQRKEAEDLKDLVRRITHLACKVEYTIDSFLVRYIPIWYCARQLRFILEEFKDKKRQVKMESGDTQSILNNIVRMEQFVQIILIVNNTEIEKLREVFNGPAITKKFDIRSWSMVSSYKERRKEVFLELLRNASYSPHVKDSDDKTQYTSNMSEDELKRSIFRLFNDQQYFIILEDVRDIDELYDITRVLPDQDEYDGSKVLFTTRSPELIVQYRYDIEKNGFQKMSRYPASTSQIDKPTIDDDVRGFNTETEEMLELLIGGSLNRQIVSIFGMPGQGKTTIAKKLYNDPLVVDYFDTRAWCFVSQVYEKKELLLELLDHVDPHSNRIHDKNVELDEMLYKNLKGRRFLIVMDDIWKIDAWKDLARCFPNDKQGSRIVFTTRIQGLTSQIESPGILKSLCPLSDDESWELLKKKVFQKESCPPDLLGIGRQIAKNCRGLPISVVLIAGILAKMEKKEDQWEYIAKTLPSHIIGDVEAQGKGIIELSYKHLSNPLKPCFLYFGVFLEDKEVPVCKLIQLWIAEGFIEHTDLKRSEDVAEGYLTDLIGRSLVIVAQEKSSGGVKSCRIHDLLREFCLTKAQEENFLEQINGYGEHFPSCDDNGDYCLDPNYSYSSTPIQYHLRRLSICSKRNHFIMLKPSGPFVRSLLFFAASDMCPSYAYDISFIFHNFKFLKILNLEDINIGDSFKGIDILVLLRYLALQGCVDFIPSSITKLWNLETFLFKGLSAKIIKVPDSIWDMANLRHLHINEIASFDLEPHRLENSPILDNLQSFSAPSLAYGNDIEKILRRLQGIRKLKCIFLDSWDDVSNYNKFPTLESLNHLVSLKVLYNGAGIYPCKFSFPSNLKKLTLSNFRMPWNEISQLAIICNLEVLKLLGNAFEGETWDMRDEEFPKLKFLKLETLNVETWTASRDNFPCLESLLLHNCGQLEEIPRDIGEIPTLLKIEVLWCSPSTAASAKEIQDEQQDFNVGLKVNILPKVWDSESPSSG